MPLDTSKEIDKGKIAERLQDLGVQGITPEQVWFYGRFSQVIGAVLDLLDASIENDRQCNYLKREIRKHLYDGLMHFLNTLPAPYGRGLPEK